MTQFGYFAELLGKEGKKYMYISENEIDNFLRKYEIANWDKCSELKVYRNNTFITLKKTHKEI